MRIQNIIKQAFCPHFYNDQSFIRNLHGDEINAFNARSMWKCKKCGKIIYSNEIYDTDSISDGYHTFGELYKHRAALTAALCHELTYIYGENKCWKSLKHSDDTMYDGMFIVGIETISGTVTYHYDISYWSDFDIKVLEKAPEWDGHTSNDVINRIDSLRFEPRPNRHFLTDEELEKLIKLQKSMYESKTKLEPSWKKSKKSLLDKILSIF